MNWSWPNVRAIELTLLNSMNLRPAAAKVRRMIHSNGHGSKLLHTLPWESDTLRSEDVDACFGNTLGA